MGNTESVETTSSAPAPASAPATEQTVINPDPTYKWPENLYVEMRDMAAAAFLVYSFGYILDAARKVGLEGLNIDEKGQAARTAATGRRLERSFTPGEVKQLIADNHWVLAEQFPDVFADPESVQESLQMMQDRIDGAGGGDRPLTLVEFDDHHQDQEMVYAVAKDDINKRISLCFRGTDNRLALYNNWSTNALIRKAPGPIPAVIEKPLSEDQIWFHRGFYGYIFDKTATTKDAPDKTKYDEILEDIKPLLQENPGYKLYVTGHSLGAALSSLAAFYLSAEDGIPLPVTCLNFASPRVGDSTYLEASTELERMQRLRFLRTVNDNDSICMAPIAGYSHAGFQVRLYKDATYEPEITYPKLEDTAWNKLSRAWGNSLIASLNFAYDHADYRERIEENREFLETQDLNALYSDSELTGFVWGSS